MVMHRHGCLAFAIVVITVSLPQLQAVSGPGEPLTPLDSRQIELDYSVPADAMPLTWVDLYYTSDQVLYRAEGL